MKTAAKLAIVILSLTALTLVSVPGAVFAGSSDGGPRGKYGQDGDWHEKKQKMMEKMTEDLGLTEEQQQKIKTHRESHQAQRKAVWQELQQKRQDLREELKQETINRAKVDDLLGRISTLQSQKLRSRVDGIYAMREILTPEQHAALQKKMEEHRAKWKDRKKGGSHGGWEQD